MGAWSGLLGWIRRIHRVKQILLRLLRVSVVKGRLERAHTQCLSSEAPMVDWVVVETVE